jgi:predicted nucleic acid-binding protein
VRFWDSSAVVPLLVRQPASTRADDWFDADAACALWTLTTVELTSALWRLVREGGLSETDAIAADIRATELAMASYLVSDIDAVKLMARRVLRTHVLRSADALQLGAALVWSGGSPQGKIFHTFDTRLALAAQREGFDVP